MTGREPQELALGPSFATQAAPRQSPATFSGVRVLLVDDEVDVLDTLKEIFAGEGFQTDSATTGSEALVKLQQRDYDVAILDIRLPDIDGIQLLARARAQQPDLVCVMATGAATKQSAVEALNRGAQAFFEKPIDVEQVLTTLRNSLQQLQRERQNRDLARILIESFLVPTPRRQDVQLATQFAFASEAALVGGDYFDFLELDEHRLGIVIGDVCGKGVPAAIFTGKAKDILYAYVRLNPSPQWVVTELNQALCPQMSEQARFITLVYGVLDTRDGTFTATNAGHPAPLIYRPGEDDFVALESDGPMVGAFAGVDYGEQTARLAPGDVLALFTDGITEARSQGEQFELEGIKAAIRASAAGDALTIAQAVFEAARRFAGGVLRDDAALIVVKNAPGTAGG